MSYMRPSYTRFAEFDTEHTRFATKYSLYLYREQGIDGGTKVGLVLPPRAQHIANHDVLHRCKESPYFSFLAMLGATSRFAQ